jgi:hypothetical protein
MQELQDVETFNIKAVYTSARKNSHTLSPVSVDLGPRVSGMRNIT